jgi:hypothetical protein
MVRSIADPRYLLVDAPIEEAPERSAFAFFAWRFSFSDLLAAVFELFEPPLSLLAMVPLRKE